MATPAHSALAPDQFREALLAIMDRKNHWAWPLFAGGRISTEQLKIHFRQEYAVYVRDFPVLLARAYGKNPPSEVRSLLAENIYEEDTGRLSLGRPHPELFLKMMTGLGFDPADFHQVELLASSAAYRRWLDQMSDQANWLIGVATLSIFVEGSLHDRRELQNPPHPKTQPEIEDAVSKHHLVEYHGVHPDFLDLVRAHQMVETGHRHAAYRMVVGHAIEPNDQRQVLDRLEEGLGLWLRYRDGVAGACGLSHP